MPFEQFEDDYRPPAEDPRLFIHQGDPKTCVQCFISVRPLCKKCGHALTGLVTMDSHTICEFCKEENFID